MLHGLLSSGDVYGATYDELAQDHRLVVPDLLGFGRSIDRTRSSFTLEHHLDALDEMASQLSLSPQGWTIAGHSLGGVLASHWAARHAERIQRVITFAALLHGDRTAALTATT